MVEKRITCPLENIGTSPLVSSRACVPLLFFAELLFTPRPRPLCRMISLIVTAAAVLSISSARVDVGDIATPVRTVAPNFIGLSIEVGGALEMIGSRGNSSALAAVLHHLYSATAPPHEGPTLRIGGNSADNSCWHTAASGHTKLQCRYVIQDADLEAYITFAAVTAKKANVSYIIDTNFGLTADPYTVAVPHVAAVLAANNSDGRRLMDHVFAFEVGNISTRVQYVRRCGCCCLQLWRC